LKAVENPKTLSLDDAFAMAVTNSVDLRVAEQSLAQSQATVRKAWAFVLPQINLSADYTFNFPEQKVNFSSPEQLQSQAGTFQTLAFLLENDAAALPAGPGQAQQQRAIREQAAGLRSAADQILNTKVDPIVIQPAQVASGALVLSMPIFSGRAFPAIQNAYAGVTISRLASTQARAAVLYGVARAYYQVVATKKIVEIAKKQVEGTTRHRDVTQQRLTEGAVTALALQRAELDVAKAEQQVRSAEGAQKMAKGALANMLAMTEDFDVAEPPPVAAIESSGNDVDLLARALQARPDVRVQKEALMIADRNVTEAWMRLLPTVSVSAQGRYTSNTSGLTSQPFTGALIFQAQLPIFDGGATWGQIEDSNASLKKELLKVHQLEDNIQTAVRGALDDIALKRDAVQTSERVLALAVASQENAERLFSLGAATNIDVLDANTAAFAAGVDAARARLDLETARLGLAYQVGELTPAAQAAPAQLSDEETSRARDLIDEVKHKD
jgi:outer membrane protein TolC